MSDHAKHQVVLPGSHTAISPVGLGTGDWEAPNDTTSTLYSLYREAGGNCFDSAHCYAFWKDAEGASERTLGELIRRHDRREDVIVATKGCHPDGGPQYPRPDAYMTPEQLSADISDSLERLGTDYIDIYFLHRDDPRIPVDEIMDALHQHQGAGHLRHYAASNWAPQRLEQAAQYAAQKGLAGFAASQILWNLGHLSHPLPSDMYSLDEAGEQWYQESQLPVFAFSSTANGYFGGRGSRGGYDNEVSAARRERAGVLAEKYGATANQIALAYLLALPVPVVALVGTMNHDHLKDALGAARIVLSPEEVLWLRNGI